MNLSEFQEMYPDHSWLEDKGGAARYSNGLAEGTEHESVWFCRECEEERDHCDCPEEDSEPWL